MINIASPYLYRGKEFLDLRQGIPKSKSDLLNWNTPVPEGFEVCLNKIWYYYDKSVSLPDTGHWVPRLASSIDEDFSNAQGISAELFKEEMNSLNLTMNNFKETLETFQNLLIKLDNNLFPYSFKSIIAGPKYTDPLVTQEVGLEIENKVTEILETGSWTSEELELYDMNGDGAITVADRTILQNMYSILTRMSSIYTEAGTSDTYYVDIGSSILPLITWSIQKKDEQEESVINSATVDGPTVGFMSKDYKSWSSKYILSSNNKEDKVYRILANVGQYEQNITGEVHFKFWDRIYYGLATTDWIYKSNVAYSELESFDSVWSNDSSFEDHTFEVEGENVATLLIPKDQFDGDNTRFYVNDTYFEDIHTKELSVENINGIVSDYVLIQVWSFDTSFNLKVQQNIPQTQKMFEVLQNVLDIEELVKRKLEIESEID